MEWVCRRCGRTHDGAPADGCLACGHATVDPATDAAEAGDGSDGIDSEALLARAHDRLFEPDSLDVDLLDSGGIVAVAFRFILAVSVLFVAAAVVSSFL